MLIELSLLPTNIVQQILQIQQGTAVKFTHNGKIIADVIPTQSSYDMLMNRMNVDFSDDLAEIEEEPFLRLV